MSDPSESNTRSLLQAGKQLGPGWKLMKGDTPGVPELSEWLAKLPTGARVGIDPFVHTNEGARKLLAALEPAGNELVPVFGGNLVDAAWEDAPPAPTVRPPRPRTWRHPCAVSPPSLKQSQTLLLVRAKPPWLWTAAVC